MRLISNTFSLTQNLKRFLFSPHSEQQWKPDYRRFIKLLQSIQHPCFWPPHVLLQWVSQLLDVATPWIHHGKLGDCADSFGTNCKSHYALQCFSSFDKLVNFPATVVFYTDFLFSCVTNQTQELHSLLSYKRLTWTLSVYINSNVQ